MTKKRILIIDDDAELGAEMMEALTGEGFFTRYSEDAGQGEALIRSGQFDIILLDYKMPLLSGVDILKRLKADHIRACIFFVSGRPSAEQALKDEGLSDRVNGIIAKPIDFKALLEKIRDF